MRHNNFISLFEGDHYAPPGSTRYVTPKPQRNGDNSIRASHISDDFTYYTYREPECDNFQECSALMSWCKAKLRIKPKFWKIFILLIFSLKMCYFLTLVALKNPADTLFVLAPYEKMNSMGRYYSTDLVKQNKSVTSSGYDPKEILKEKFLDFKSRLTNINKTVLVKNNTKIHKDLPMVGLRETQQIKNISYENLKICPPIPPNLNGQVTLYLKDVPSLGEQEIFHSELLPGGHFLPPDCKARHKVAIIIPYRDRQEHLKIFLMNIHNFLQSQQIDYTIFIIEQTKLERFNRAMLMNIGSIEAIKLYPFDCYIFHDVDLVPEDSRNLYTCPEQPRHMSVAINNMKYKLPYNDIFGGVSSMTVKQFQTVNGFSNAFWGWGGEDDDMSNRIKYYGFYISRYPANIGRYTMISHKKDTPNPQRFRILNGGKKRFKKDGLVDVSYKVKDIKLHRLYTHIRVELIKS